MARQVQGTSSGFSEGEETLFRENPQLSQEIWPRTHCVVQEASRQLEYMQMETGELRPFSLCSVCKLLPRF